VSWTVPPGGTNGIAGSGLIARSYSGTLGAITAAPGGSIIANFIPVSNNATYVSGNYYQDIKFTHPINAAGTLQCFDFHTILGSFQFSISPTYTILTTQQLTSVVRISWDRGSH
jgi:hypothetical protein